MVEPFFYGSIVQLVVGTVLFAVTGYAITLAALGDKTGAVEKIVFTLCFGFFLPVIAIFALNYLIGIQMNAVIVAIIYAITATAAFGLHWHKGPLLTLR